MFLKQTESQLNYRIEEQLTKSDMSQMIEVRRSHDNKGEDGEQEQEQEEREEEQDKDEPEEQGYEVSILSTIILCD